MTTVLGWLNAGMTPEQLLAGHDTPRQVLMALSVPIMGMLGVRCIEAGLGLWVALAFLCSALCTLLCRVHLDAFFWTHIIGEDSNEPFELRSVRQRHRYKIAQKGFFFQCICATLYHISSLTLQGRSCH